MIGMLCLKGQEREELFGHGNQLIGFLCSALAIALLAVGTKKSQAPRL